MKWQFGRSQKIGCLRVGAKHGKFDPLMQRLKSAENCEVGFDFGDSALKDISAKLGRTERTTKDLKAVTEPRDQVAIEHSERLSVLVLEERDIR